MSIIDFFFLRFKNPRDQIFPMHQVRDIAEKINFTTGDRFATTWSVFFSTWITDEVIKFLLLRIVNFAEYI